MPKEDGIGFSESTKIKIPHLEKILGMHLAVTQAVLNKNAVYVKQYRYIDLTSGKGFTRDGTRGSPLVFLSQVWSEKFKTPFRADFIELHDKNINALKNTIVAEAEKNNWRTENLHFHHGDYRQKAHELLPFVDKNELGLVFADPSGNLPDFDTLRYVAEVRPRMEILIYLSSTNVKRVYQYTRRFLSDYMDHIGKKYWLFRKPISWDQFKWIFLLGSNTRLFKDYTSIDFFRLDSERGQELFQRVNLTEKQQLDQIQPKLFDE